jgi:hypothetical protein
MRKAIYLQQKWPGPFRLLSLYKYLYHYLFQSIIDDRKTRQAEQEQEQEQERLEAEEAKRKIAECHDRKKPHARQLVVCRQGHHCATTLSTTRPCVLRHPLVHVVDHKTLELERIAFKTLRFDHSYSEIVYCP